MLKVLKNQLDDAPINDEWLQAFWIDFRRRFVSLLGYQFRQLSPALALAVLHNKSVKDSHTGIVRSQVVLEITLKISSDPQIFPAMSWKFT